MSLIYGAYLVNVHFGNIPHSFIPHPSLRRKKIRIQFSANYPLTFFCIPQSAKKTPSPFYTCVHGCSLSCVCRDSFGAELCRTICLEW